MKDNPYLLGLREYSLVLDLERSTEKLSPYEKTEKFSRNKKGKREYLNDVKTGDFTRKLNAYFKSEVEIPRIKVGKKQEIETLINEEALLFAKYLRNERKTWNPRIVSL